MTPNEQNRLSRIDERKTRAYIVGAVVAVLVALVCLLVGYLIERYDGIVYLIKFGMEQS
jgi:hypothetical protein